MSPIPPADELVHSESMIDELPPPSSMDVPDRAPTSRFADPAALFFAALGVGVLVAIAAGVVGGGLAALVTSSGCPPDDGFCVLGAIVFGLMVGVAAAVIGYVVSGVIVIRRHRDHGERAVPLLAHLAAAPVAAATFMLLLGLIP